MEPEIKNKNYIIIYSFFSFSQNLLQLNSNVLKLREKLFINLQVNLEL